MGAPRGGETDQGAKAKGDSGVTAETKFTPRLRVVPKVLAKKVRQVSRLVIDAFLLAQPPFMSFAIFLLRGFPIVV